MHNLTPILESLEHITGRGGNLRTKYDKIKKDENDV